jgi:hypothetical protein
MEKYRVVVKNNYLTYDIAGKKWLCNNSEEHLKQVKLLSLVKLSVSLPPFESVVRKYIFR